MSIFLFARLLALVVTALALRMLRLALRFRVVLMASATAVIAPVFAAVVVIEVRTSVRLFPLLHELVVFVALAICELVVVSASDVNVLATLFAVRP
jgi:hypothetical protein